MAYEFFQLDDYILSGKTLLHSAIDGGFQGDFFDLFYKSNRKIGSGEGQTNTIEQNN